MIDRTRPAAPNGCERFALALSRRVDGELEREPDALETHLDSCDDCQRRLDEERGALDALRAELAATPTSLRELEHRLLPSVRAALAALPVRPSIRVLPGVLSAAAGLVVGVVLWVVFVGGGAPAPDQSDPVGRTVEVLAPAGSRSAYDPIVELQRSTRRFEPLPVSTDGRADPGDDRLGLEVIHARRWIVGPSSDSIDSEKPAAAARVPRWRIDLEGTRTRVVRVPARPWY